MYSMRPYNVQDHRSDQFLEKIIPTEDPQNTAGGLGVGAVSLLRVVLLIKYHGVKHIKARE